MKAGKAAAEGKASWHRAPARRQGCGRARRCATVFPLQTLGARWVPAAGTTGTGTALDDRAFRLRLLRQNADPKVVEVKRGQSVILGRTMDCDVLLDDPSINGMHMRLSFKPDGRVHLQDFVSLWGTLVNSQRIKKPSLSGAESVHAVA